MPEDTGHPWLTMLVGSFLTAVLTLGGSYLLELHKAKIDVWKDETVRQQAQALIKLGQELSSLDGDLTYLNRAAARRAADSELRKQAVDIATLMTEIFKNSELLDDSFASKSAIHELRESLAPLIAGMNESPQQNSARLAPFYSGEFAPKLKAAESALEDDKRKLAPFNL